DIEVGGGRQEALLQLFGTELGDDRADHRGVEGQRVGHAGQLHLVLPDMPLHGRPVLAAPFHRPVRYGQAVLVEDLVRGHDVLAGQLVTVLHAFTDLGGNRGGVDLPQLVAEGDL